MSQRSLRLSGASNFRDLGGYATADGRRVRWRRIFRSNHLGRLSDDDVAVLRDLGLRKVFDFRSNEEIAQAEANRLPGPEVHVLSIAPGIRPRLEAKIAEKGHVTADDAMAMVQAVYRNYIRQYGNHFREVFNHLVEDNAPLVLHCSAGKDRTGVASALILAALGVPRDTIMEDYLLTRTLWKIDPQVSTGLPAEAAAVLSSVDESFLHAAFNALDDDFGGIEGYLRGELGINAARHDRLRALYLEG